MLAQFCSWTQHYMYCRYRWSWFLSSIRFTTRCYRQTPNAIELFILALFLLILFIYFYLCVRTDAPPSSLLFTAALLQRGLLRCRPWCWFSLWPIITGGCWFTHETAPVIIQSQILPSAPRAAASLWKWMICFLSVFSLLQQNLYLRCCKVWMWRGLLAPHRV